MKALYDGFKGRGLGKLLMVAIEVELFFTVLRGRKGPCTSEYNFKRNLSSSPLFAGHQHW